MILYIEQTKSLYMYIVDMFTIVFPVCLFKPNFLLVFSTFHFLDMHILLVDKTHQCIFKQMKMEFEKNFAH